jgi:hypothetical protein
VSNLPYQLATFSEAERKYFEREAGNVFALALSQAHRYLNFADIIRVRVEKTSAKFIASLKKYQEMVNEGHRKLGKSDRYLTKKEEAQLRRKNINAQIFQLEIESFYIFRKSIWIKQRTFLKSILVSAVTARLNHSLSSY